MWESLHELPFPVLFLFGENDSKYHPIAKRLEMDFLVDLLPECGHAIHLEAPKLCREKIQDFCRSQLTTLI